MDPLTLGLIGGGQLLNSFFNWRSGRSQENERRRRQGLAEPLLMQMASGAQGFNVGQDALAQMLRSNPWASSDTAMNSLVETGNPFDTTELFESLGMMDARAREDALAGVRAGASGLGQRFGTAMMRESNNAMQELLDAAAARNAGIAMQSHESAQGRRLGAAQQLNQNIMSRTGVAQALGQMTAGQDQQRLQALGMMLGLPMGGAPPTVGTDIAQIGQLMAMMQLLGQGGD